MRKRKTIALTLLFLFLLSSVCMAYQPDPARWGWISSDSDVGIFYDKKTVQHYTYYSDYYDVWIMFVYPAKKEYMMHHQIIYKNKTIKIKEVVTYSYSGYLIDSSDFSSFPADGIVPNSVGEAVYDHFYR